MSMFIITYIVSWQYLNEKKKNKTQQNTKHKTKNHTTRNQKYQEEEAIGRI